jgi:hypothetical protein
MQEVLVQSISERSVDQPLEVKPEDMPRVSLTSDSWVHVSESSSLEELNFQSGRPDEESLTCAASEFSGHSESNRDRPSEALGVVHEQSSEVPTELGVCTDVSAAGQKQTADISQRNELPVPEANSVEEMNSFLEQLEGEVQLSNGRSKINIPQDRLREVNVDP